MVNCFKSTSFFCTKSLIWIRLSLLLARESIERLFQRIQPQNHLIVVKLNQLLTSVYIGKWLVNVTMVSYEGSPTLGRIIYIKWYEWVPDPTYRQRLDEWYRHSRMTYSIQRSLRKPDLTGLTEAFVHREPSSTTYVRFHRVLQSEFLLFRATLFRILLTSCNLSMARHFRLSNIALKLIMKKL